MSVSSYKVGGFTPSNGLSEREMDTAFRMCKKYGIQNLINCGWGDGGAEASVFSILPSIANVSGKAYGRTRVEMKAEFYALTGYTYNNFLKLEWADSGCGKYTKDNVKVTKVMLYNDILLGQLDTEVDPEYTPNFSRAANAIARSAKGQYEYVFRSVAAIARVMAVKYELGVRLRAAYKAGDKEGMRAIIPELEKTIRRLEIFIGLHKERWMKENKPHGFDVQEYRLGGVIQRLKGTIGRIEAYLSGKDASIPELEETLYKDVLIGRNAYTGRMGYNDYQLISSVNKF